MNIKEIKTGSRVLLSTKKGEFECTILESPTSDIILVKLKSGYNIGVREEDILSVRDLRNRDKKEEKTKKEKEIKTKKDLPKIVLISTGGTISSRLDVKTGAVKWLSDPQELLKVYPEILDVAEIVKIETPFMKASENMSAEDWEKISEVIGKHINNKDVSGIIVTHGTDFLHYTASALSFSLKNLNKPVVLTYSQRSSDRASSDARLNLICAAKIAVSDIAEVVLVGHANSSDDYCYVLRGTKVRKMHTSRRDTFRPINSEAIARVSRDKVEFLSRYNIRSESKKTEVIGKFSDKVGLIKFYPGQDPEILEHYKSRGYKGLVIEGSGLGHVLTGEKNNWLPKLRKLVREGMIVCIAPQTLYGRLDPYVYSAGRETLDTGVIYLRDMLPETAFVKLSWALANTRDKSKIKQVMLSNLAGEFSPRISEKEFLN